MFIQKTHPNDLPKDAVILSDEKAFEHQLKLVNNWDKWSEVWPLRSGISILAVAASGTGIYINGHYRRKLKLRKFGFGASYLPIVVLPGIISGFFHKMFVTPQVLLEKSDCPVCLQTKAALLQVSIGFFYPLLLAPAGCFMLATRHATYRLPDITKDYFGAFRTLVKFARPIGTQLSFIFVGQLLLGSYFTYLEAKSYYKVKQHMLRIEREYEDSRTNDD